MALNTLEPYLENLLDDLKIDKGIFLSEKIYTMEEVFDLEEKDLVELKLKMGDRKKLLKASIKGVQL